ncbi:hypothetical protein [Prochlorococcus marinus]|uniref:hypothetical protein n=1 Tax=Prochlorococcus marinus TaxID=1219 RepID=UPI0022B461EB|nr:hypothetical protein [Prochlorococcus marinus]
MFKNILMVSLGLFCGLWASWPGITKNQSWICAKNLIIDSREQKTPIRAILAVPPKYFLGRKSYKGILGRTRILGDACFR